jgi:hypothetical protein
MRGDEKWMEGGNSMDRRILPIVVIALMTIASVGIVAGLYDPPVPEPKKLDSVKGTSSMTLTLAEKSMNVGTSMHADGQLIGTNSIVGVPIIVKIVKPDGSKVDPVQGSTVMTDSSGKFGADFTPITVGAYMVSVSFAGNDKYNGSSATVQFSAIKAEKEPTPIPTPTPTPTPKATPTPEPEKERVQCDKPWPSKIDMIKVPTSMVAGETYTFKCQMFVRQYNTYCEILPWTYGLDAPIVWTFKNGNGISVSVESTTSPTDATWPGSGAWRRTGPVMLSIWRSTATPA